MHPVESPSPDHPTTSAPARGCQHGAEGQPIVVLAYSYLEGGAMAIDHYSTATAMLAALVFRAGASLLGETKISVALGDWQANNPVYGVFYAGNGDRYAGACSLNDRDAHPWHAHVAPSGQ